MSLYLKYRPKDFESLVWQEFIKETLQKAVANEKTVWAYLFCWPRWTWKTSTARIFAKALNCENGDSWNPCNNCSICNAINTESLIDVIEIDAASHTWVDNIREIIEKAQFRPTNAKYKIYIIDEVHMLSKWAFNALLKILEEPPEYVKFILATTETHKVPETIISRCQRYDFKNHTLENIKNRLKFIASEEKIQIDEKSLNYIAKASSWWLRNAISLFEQLVVDNEINFSKLISSLWIVEENILDDFLTKLTNKNREVVDDFESILESWKNIKIFFKQLIFFTKEKVLLKLKSWENISNLIKILDELNETYSKTKNSLDESTTFLIWILKILEEKNNLIPIFFEEKESTSIDISLKHPEISSISKEDKKANILNESDLLDVFWDFEEEKKEEKFENISSFNTELFFKTLKEVWAKWAIIMSLKWAEIKQEWKDLKIFFKTKFALNSVNNGESLSIINQAIQNMKLNLNVKLM